MANKITYSSLYAERFIPPTSRYIDSRVLQYSEQNILTFEIYKRKKHESKGEDRFTVITPGYEYRPDLLSNAIYGVSDFWWRIMEVNNIWDIYDFKAGTNILIPIDIFY
jgi:hypothetical protein